MFGVRATYLVVALVSLTVSFLQQSVPHFLPLSLQQAAQASLQHFLQADSAKPEVVARAMTARRVRMDFISLDQFGCSVYPLVDHRGPVAGRAGSRSCHKGRKVVSHA